MKKKCFRIEKIIKDLIKKTALPKPRVHIIKSDQVNAASITNVKPQILIITTKALEILNQRELIGLFAHEFGHLVSLRSKQAKKTYQLTSSVHSAYFLVHAEYVADHIATQLVGVKPVLMSLCFSKAYLLHTVRGDMFNRLVKDNIPRPISKLLVRITKKVWYADDYQAPTLDFRIKHLKENA